MGCALLAVLTLAAYSTVVRNGFINFDDPGYVAENAHVHAGLSLGTLKWSFSTTEQGNWHPLTWLSHALDWQLFRQNPAGHHVTSLLFHLLNVILLFLLLARATGAPGRSFLVAALFAVHPLNVETVAWIAERKSVLSTAFLLAAIGAYGWYVRRPSLQRYLAPVGLFALGLASKPMVITLPCVLLLLDFWPLQRIEGWTSSTPPFPAGQIRFWRLVLEKLPLIGLAAASAVITFVAQRSAGAMPTVKDLPLKLRIENAIHSYAIYAGKAFWPAGLGIFYPGHFLTIWQILLPLLFLVAVSVLVWRERARRPYLITGWLWFLGTLVPVIGIVQVGSQAMADRYAYIPLIGVFVMAVWGAAELSGSKAPTIGRSVTAAAIVLGGLTFVTWRQVSYWRNSVDLWSHTLDVTSNNFVGEEALGEALMKLGRDQEAWPHFINAAGIDPRDPAPHLNLGAILAIHDRPEQAVNEYETAVKLHLDSQSLGIAYEKLGDAYRQLGDTAKARESYVHGVKIDPQQSTIWQALARLDLEDNTRKLSKTVANNSPK